MLECTVLEYPIFRERCMAPPRELKPISAQAFEEEALAAWEHYQETGLHLSLKEVRDWLATWGAPSEKEAPKCHK